jgi:hypothetical protein
MTQFVNQLQPDTAEWRFRRNLHGVHVRGIRGTTNAFLVHAERHIPNSAYWDVGVGTGENKLLCVDCHSVHPVSGSAVAGKNLRTDVITAVTAGWPDAQYLTDWPTAEYLSDNYSRWYGKSLVYTADAFGLNPAVGGTATLTVTLDLGVVRTDVWIAVLRAGMQEGAWKSRSGYQPTSVAMGTSADGVTYLATAPVSEQITGAGLWWPQMALTGRSLRYVRYRITKDFGPAGSGTEYLILNEMLATDGSNPAISTNFAYGRTYTKSHEPLVATTDRYRGHSGCAVTGSCHTCEWCHTSPGNPGGGTDRKACYECNLTGHATPALPHSGNATERIMGTYTGLTWHQPGSNRGSSGGADFVIPY